MAAILFSDHWKTELQNVLYSNVFGIPMFSNQAPTVLIPRVSILVPCAKYLDVLTLPYISIKYKNMFKNNTMYSICMNTYFQIT